MFTLLKSVKVFKKAVIKNMVIPVESEIEIDTAPGQRFEESKFDQIVITSHLPSTNQDAIAHYKTVIRAKLSKMGLVERFARAILIRLLLIVYSIIIVYFMACITTDNNYWYLMIPVLFIALDTLFICIVRKGIEFNW